MSIPVICDRCRATGISGEADFSHLGDLLEFEPVPRKTQRADGWTPERQRAFIAALSATGSKRQAAIAIGMAAYGVDQLLKAEGNEGFRAAFDRAMAIAQANGSLRIAKGVADAAARNAQLAPPSRLRGHQPPPEPEYSEDHKWDLIHSVGIKFMRKVAAERSARLGGEIVAADFYLRQITVMEVMLDLMSTDFGFDAQAVLRQLRRGDHSLPQIASTWLSDWMDRARRMWWEQEGEPERPPHPDVRFLERRPSPDGDYATQVDQHTYGKPSQPAWGYTVEQWQALTMDEQVAARERQFRQEAEDQRNWEAKAHREYEEMRGGRTAP